MTLGRSPVKMVDINTSHSAFGHSHGSILKAITRSMIDCQTYWYAAGMLGGLHTGERYSCANTYRQTSNRSGRKLGRAVVDESGETSFLLLVCSDVRLRFEMTTLLAVYVGGSLAKEE